MKHPYWQYLPELLIVLGFLITFIAILASPTF